DNSNPDGIASFSSRGPIGSRLAPAISAPGVGIRSSFRNNAYGTISGTSMAGPHVAGAVALLVSRHPWLANHPDRVRSVLESTAAPRPSTQNCGTFPGASVPNAVFGHGRLDVKAALDVVGDWLFLDSFNAR
ncbi:MAG: S8 family serine peptidase, partial [Lysobacterales bacterium]